MYTRRAFLKAGGLALFAAGLGGSPAFLARAAGLSTRGPASRKILVAIFQRGAMDGLMAVPPYADPWLKQYRPDLYMDAARNVTTRNVVDLDGRFGLHPGLGPLLPLFHGGKLAIVHGVGSPDPTRSHFDAQDYMETGTPGRKGTDSGWLDRVLGQLGHEPATPFRAVSITPALPRSLYGPEPALAIANLREFGVTAVGKGPAAEETGATFESLYANAADRLLRDTGEDSFEASRVLSRANLQSYAPAHGADYPKLPLGNALKQIAMLIKSNVGLEIGFAEMGGWDTHVQQGAGNGVFARRAEELAGSIAAFWTDIGEFQDRVVLMTMTEFGRTVHENGSGGTDHGRASCLFVLGNDVMGGRIHGNVGSLRTDDLEDRRDLPVTTDFRSVFAEVAGKQFGIRRDSALFPDWSGPRLDLLRT